MTMKDAKGREYARLGQLRPGDRVRVDDGFTCLSPGEVCEVFEDVGGPFVLCGGSQDGATDRPRARRRREHHYLAGPLCDDRNDDSLVGVYPDA